MSISSRVHACASSKSVCLFTSVQARVKPRDSFLSNDLRCDLAPTELELSRRCGPAWEQAQIQSIPSYHVSFQIFSNVKPSQAPSMRPGIFLFLVQDFDMAARHFLPVAGYKRTKYGGATVSDVQTGYETPIPGCTYCTELYLLLCRAWISSHPTALLFGGCYLLGIHQAGCIEDLHLADTSPHVQQTYTSEADPKGIVVDSHVFWNTLAHSVSIEYTRLCQVRSMDGANGSWYATEDSTARYLISSLSKSGNLFRIATLGKLLGLDRRSLAWNSEHDTIRLGARTFFFFFFGGARLGKAGGDYFSLPAPGSN